ncbi:MAG: ligand-gated channel protein [Rhodospirillales bacterium]|nr:ligand-gated channel protein [Rhodospirillales bacterium]
MRDVVSACGARSMRVLGAALVVGMLLGVLPAAAQVEKRHFDIPGQELSAALKSFALAAGVELFYPPDLVRGKTAAPLRGDYSNTDALASLLAGSGLSYEFTGPKTLILQRAGERRSDAAAVVPSAAASVRPAQTEDIVVTALKRSTKLQDTPISMSAVSGNQLENSNIRDVAELTRQVPGMSTVDAGPGLRRIVIRGIQGAGEPQVGIYYDEAPVSGSPGTTADAGSHGPDLKLFDVQQVEVLRGPQGTLYGSGSMGGTVRVIFRKPANEFEAAVDASLASTRYGGMSYEANGMVNLPLVDEKVAARLVAYHRDRDGYIDNPGLHLKDVNDETTSGGRLLVRFTPTDDLRIDAAAFLQRTDAHQPIWYPAAGKFNSRNQAQLPLQDDYDLYNVTAQWNLGFATLTGVSSYYRRAQVQGYDTSDQLAGLRNVPSICAALRGGGGPCNAAQLASYNSYVNTVTPSLLYQPQNVRSWTNELRLSSTPGGPLNWTAGIFTESRRAYVTSRIESTDPANGLPYQPLRIGTARDLHDKLTQKAAFGEFSYEALPGLTLTAGTRYFEYRKNIVGETTVGLDLIGARLTPPTYVSSDESGWVSKFNVAYKLNPNMLVYVQAAEGFRPGGANQVLGLADNLTPYQSDSLWNYEAGLKTSWFDGRAIVNVDAYQIDWNNMQVTGITANGAYRFISNAGAARVRGIEFESSYSPIAGLDLQANATFSKAELSEDQINPQIVGAGRKGDRIPYVPKVTLSGAVQYVWPVWSDVNGFVRADVSYVGSSWSEFRPNNPFQQHIDSYSLTNLRIGIEHGADWGAYLFVNNLFDSTAIVYATASAVSGGQVNAVSALPRTIGINLRKRF